MEQFSCLISGLFGAAGGTTMGYFALKYLIKKEVKEEVKEDIDAIQAQIKDLQENKATKNDIDSIWKKFDKHKEETKETYASKEVFHLAMEYQNKDIADIKKTVERIEGKIDRK